MKHEAVLKKIVGSTDVVHVVDDAVAKSLIEDGMVKQAGISPAPKKGQTAVNLTARGRAFKGPIDTPLAPT